MAICNFLELKELRHDVLSHYFDGLSHGLSVGKPKTNSLLMEEKTKGVILKQKGTNVAEDGEDWNRLEMTILKSLANFFKMHKRWCSSFNETKSAIIMGMQRMRRWLLLCRLLHKLLTNGTFTTVTVETPTSILFQCSWIKRACITDPCTAEPWFNEVAGASVNLFIKSRIHYIESLNITNFRGNDQTVHFIEV